MERGGWEWVGEADAVQGLKAGSLLSEEAKTGLNKQKYRSYLNK